MFCVVRDYSNSKEKAKQYKRKTSPQSYKTQIIKIIPYPGKGYSGGPRAPLLGLARHIYVR